MDTRRIVRTPYTPIIMVLRWCCGTLETNLKAPDADKIPTWSERFHRFRSSLPQLFPSVALGRLVFLFLTSSRCLNYIFHLPDWSTDRLPIASFQSLSLLPLHPNEKKKMSSNQRPPSYHHSWTASSFPPSSTPAPKSALQLALQNHRTAPRHSSHSRNTLSRVTFPLSQNTR